MGISQKKAQVSGQLVFLMCENGARYKNLAKYYENQVVSNVYIRSCRILHGSYSWIVTIATNLLSYGTSPAIEHWWVILQTKYAYYTINIWVNNAVTIQRNTSWRAANQVGLACAGKNTDADEWTSYNCTCSRKLKQFTAFIRQNISAYYQLLVNNCQKVSWQIYDFA